MKIRGIMAIWLCGPLLLLACSNGLEANKSKSLLSTIDIYKSSIIFSEDSQKITTALRDKDLVIYDLNTGAEIKSTPQFEGYNHRLENGSIIRSSSDGSVVASYELHEGIVKVWNGETLNQVQEFTVHKRDGKTLTHMAVSSDGKHLAVPAPGTEDVHIWDAASGQKTHELSATIQSGYIPKAQVKFGPNNNFLYVRHSPLEAHIWNVRSGRIVHSFSKGPWYMQFSRDGESAFFLVDETVGSVNLSTWEVESETTVKEGLTGSISVTDPSVSADGHKLLYVRGHDAGPGSSTWLYYSVEIWDLKKHALITTLGEPAPQDAHGLGNIAYDRPRMVRLSPDGSFAIVEFSAGFVSVWDVETGTLIFKDKTGSNTGYFSPDSKRLVHGSAGHSLDIYDLEVLRSLALH